jgi:hypothetical protein
MRSCSATILSPIARAAEVLGRIDRAGLGQPTAGASELTHVLFDHEATPRRRAL